MANPVTGRFIKVHDRLKDEGKIRSSRQFAMTINTAPQSLHEILKGNRDVTVKNMLNLIEEFDVRSEYLLAGEDPMFREEVVEQEVITPVQESLIKYIPIDAQAGYFDQFVDQSYIDEQVSFHIPGYNPQRGEHRCFDISGDSMEPTLFGGSKVICSLVSRDCNYANVRNNYVYVVVANNDIVVKRVINNIKSDGTLYLKSDNEYYQPYSVHADEVVEIWQVNEKIEHFMHNPSNVRNAFHTEINTLKTTIHSQAEHISKLNNSVESLLRKNR